MSILLDLRCPKCNRPVYGKQDVKHVKKLAKILVCCQYCKRSVVAGMPTQTDLGTEVWYIEDTLKN